MEMLYNNQPKIHFESYQIQTIHVYPSAIHATYPYICNPYDSVLIVSWCWPMVWYPFLHIIYTRCALLCQPSQSYRDNMYKISCALLQCGSYVDGDPSITWYLRIWYCYYTQRTVTFTDMRNSVDRCEYKLAIFMTRVLIVWVGTRGGVVFPPPLPALPSLSVLLCLSAAKRRMIGGQ